MALVAGADVAKGRWVVVALLALDIPACMSVSRSFSG